MEGGLSEPWRGWQVILGEGVLGGVSGSGKSRQITQDTYNLTLTHRNWADVISICGGPGSIVTLSASEDIQCRCSLCGAEQEGCKHFQGGDVYFVVK